MEEEVPEANTTIDSALTCPNPDVTSPTGLPIGPFPGILTKGIYQNPQPSYGWRPRLLSLTLTAKNSLNRYDETLAPEWVAAFIPSVDAPSSVADFESIVAAGELENPGTHPFFFRLAAPAATAQALVYLANGGYGYTPPVDSTGRWWGLLVRANTIPIGGIIRISANWSVERDPQISVGEIVNGPPEGHPDAG